MTFPCYGKDVHDELQERELTVLKGIYPQEQNIPHFLPWYEFLFFFILLGVIWSIGPHFTPNIPDEHFLTAAIIGAEILRWRYLARVKPQKE